MKTRLDRVTVIKFMMAGFCAWYIGTVVAIVVNGDDGACQCECKE